MKTTKKNIKNRKKNTKKNKRKIYLLKGGGDDDGLNEYTDPVKKDLIIDPLKALGSSLFNFGSSMAQYAIEHDPRTIIFRAAYDKFKIAKDYLMVGFSSFQDYIVKNKTLIQTSIKNVTDLAKPPTANQSGSSITGSVVAPPQAVGGKRKLKKTK